MTPSFAIRLFRCTGPLALLFGATLLPSTSSGQTPQWLPVTTQPSLRFQPALAQHPHTGRPLLFSGAILPGADADAIADLWEWSGRAWVRRRHVGPPGRSGGAMTLDTGRGRVVLFGGYSAYGTALDDTWEYDGTTWIRSVGAAMPPAGQQALAYDPLRGRSVLFAQAIASTWEWDGTSWTPVASTLAPPARVSTAMVFDARLGKVLLFGGRVPSRGILPLGDTWTFDGAWTQLALNATPARYDHALVFDPIRQRTVAAGGAGTQAGSPIYLRDTWELGPAGWQAAQIAPPTPFIVAGPGAFDPVEARVLVTSVEPTATQLPEMATWSWDGANWQRAALPAEPTTRSYHGFVADAVPGRMLLFGGYGYNAAAILGDSWVWDGQRWLAQTPIVSPPARFGFCIATDAQRGRVVLFGGEDATNTTLGDTWEWDGAQWQGRSPAAAPAPRGLGQMAADAARGEVVLQGGADHFQTFADTWIWNGVTWRLAATSGPGARIWGTMAFDRVSNNVLLFGGGMNGASRNDLWSWNGSSWSPIATPATAPWPRHRHTMAFDTLRGRLVVHGGLVTFTQGNTWEWDGRAWTQTWTAGLPDYLPVSAGATSMAFDELRGQMLLYDGLQLWTYTATPALDLEFGTGCGGAGGPLRLAAPDRPALGNSAFQLELLGAPAARPAVLFLGLQPSAQSLGGGCIAWIQPSAIWQVALTETASASTLVAAPIPADPTLFGLALGVQALVFDPSAPLGFGVSNGLGLSLGH